MRGAGSYENNEACDAEDWEVDPVRQSQAPEVVPHGFPTSKEDVGSTPTNDALHQYSSSLLLAFGARVHLLLYSS